MKTASHTVGKQELSCNSVFTDHMVLQRNKPIPIWGKGESGISVSVMFLERTVQTVVDEHGDWMLYLPEIECGGPDELTVTSGDESLTFEDVVLGDVWLAGGQSNMQWSMSQSSDGDAALKKGITNSNIRIFHVGIHSCLDAQRNVLVQSSWHLATSESLKDVSAVAWFFAEKLQSEIDVPVGVILSCRGGVPAHVWLPEVVAKGVTNTASIYHRFEKAKQRSSGGTNNCDEKTEADSDTFMQHYPSGYYNGMIAPLQPFALKGVIWYQGETDRFNSEVYHEHFSKLIVSWRDGFSQPKLPFVFVQLPRFLYKKGIPERLSGNLYPYIREAQLKCLELPDTSMAITIDTGEIDTIHPPAKKKVGYRLALAALGDVYDGEKPHMGPIARSVTKRDGTFKIEFNNVGQGLVVKGDCLNGFECAGKDGVFVAAAASLWGNGVIVSCETVCNPEFIRYAFSGAPEANLYNSRDLPASPFRNDNFFNPVFEAEAHDPHP